MENCWDYFKCSEKIKEKCPAYKNCMGRECWMLSETPSHRKEKPEYCWKCPWFQKMNPDFEKNKKGVEENLSEEER